MNNIIYNASKGYGYSYASLSDIAKQGIAIPKMKTGTEDGKEYVYCYDTELKEWIRGAEVVIPETKGMNKSQVYGSALTYARRYSVLMICSLSCDDDKIIEDIAQDGTRKSDDKKKPKAKEEKKTEEAKVSYKKQLIDYCDSNNIALQEVAKKYKCNANTTDDDFKEILKALKGE